MAPASALRPPGAAGRRAPRRALRVLLGALLLAAGACASLPAAGRPPALWGPLSPGPHGVGYRVLQAADPDRSARGTDGPRPVQIVVWYPTAARFAAGGSRVRDVWLLTAAQDGSAPPPAAAAAARLERFVALLASNGVPQEAARAWLDGPLAGVPDAAPAAGRWPLVLIAQGNFQAAYDQAVLAELLASHGYAVATTPSPSLIDGPMAEGESPFRQADAQALDLAFAVSRLRRLGWVDTRRVAVVGHSFGARAALLLGLRLPLAGVVSLDGGIANRQGGDWLDGVAFDRAGWTTPLLHLYEEGDPAIDPDFTLLDALVNAPRTVVRVDGLPHLGFTSLGLAAGVVPGFSLGPGTPPDVAARAAAVVEVTRRFLDRVLRRRRGDLLEVPGRRYLTPRPAPPPPG